MEPDIIRMYSSSPPPLDNGAEEEEDDDEFGEFGGFSEVSPSGVGFVDFDTPDFTRPKEDFVPSNHFMPIHEYSENVDSLTNFKSIKNGNDKAITAELYTPVKGQSDILLSTTSKETISSKTLDLSIDGTESPGDVNEVVEQEPNVGTSRSFSPGAFRTDTNIVHQTKQLESCNGEKPPCLEILTNGFVGLETVKPQGTGDLDNGADSKGWNLLSTLSTEESLDSAPSPVEEFADFARFSQKERTQLGEIECVVSNDRATLTLQDNNEIHRVTPLNSAPEVSLDGSLGGKGDTGGEHEVCVSEVGAVTDRGFRMEEQGLQTLHQDELSNAHIQPKAWSLVHSDDNSEAIRRESCKPEKKTDLFTSKCVDLSINSMKISNYTEDVGSSREGSKTLTNSKSPNIDHIEEIVLDNSASMKAVDSRNSLVAGSHTKEVDFGDFGTAGGTPPPVVIGPQDSGRDGVFEESSEHFPHFGEPGDDFGEFGVTNAASCQEEIITESDPKQTSDSLSEECQLARKSSRAAREPASKLENGQDGEFGDFDSVPDPEAGSGASQDADDFADFSAAGPGQLVDWNAFEEQPKDGCSWATFGEQQPTECHHPKEAWQSHRTAGDADPAGTPPMHSGLLATSKGAVAGGHLQESATSVQTALLNRLERIFEACFPSVFVPNTEEEEVTSLKHLLETSTWPVKARAALTESGELLDVWTELQDVHDAHGLRYQWGGSHSNKQLLCSLGIDTRNILFTGNKKQPVIVPMYAAGLGMLEPTKEPLKPLSAAEKIASIGQTTTMTPEINTSDQFQESLPPVQFDWSSSGLTNPLDGVDPELYELTTAKLEIPTSGLRVTDAFAKLMSTVEKTSSAARNRTRDEPLSEEAAQVIASLPDLTFMHAKVLMFPATLTPATGAQEPAD